MQNPQLDDSENEYSKSVESPSQTYESDNAWQRNSIKSVPEEDFERWNTEKERYDEIIEYIKEVDEILDLIKPFPRDYNLKTIEPQQQHLVRSDSETPTTRFGFDHLENIIKLVEQLKELQENHVKLSDRTSYLKDLKKIREHKKRLKHEEWELRSRTRRLENLYSENFESASREFNKDFIDLPDDLSKNRRSKSTPSEKLELEPQFTEGWQDKRKSLSLSQKVNFHENKSKISKWTKVKEAFHWERTSHLGAKPNKKEVYPVPIERGFSYDRNKGRALDNAENVDCFRETSPDDGSSVFTLDTFHSPACLPPPPPTPSELESRSSSSKPEDMLPLHPLQDLPSSSSSDKLDDLLSFSEIFKKGSDTSGQLFTTEDSDDLESIVRKSSSEELMLGQIPEYLYKDEFASSRLSKSNKTTWGKVKDIIQTRTDSLKKKPKKRGSDEFKKRRDLPSLPDTQFSDQFEDLSSPEDKLKHIENYSSKNVFELSTDPSALVPSNNEDKSTKTLMPALTITLPSTEELRSFPYDDLERRDGPDDEKINILNNFSCQAQYCEDKQKFGKNKSGQNQRLSRWVKVKRVFLTSTSPSRPPHYVSGNNLSPTGHKSSGFFSDMESDDVSSGEWVDDKSTFQEKLKLTDSEANPGTIPLIQEDVRKSYNELQKKLSHEFDQKLREWEIKNEKKNEAPKQEESATKLGKVEDGDTIPKFRKARDSITVPLPSLNDLSPEFKKKLNDWKKIKTSQSTSSVPTNKDEIQSQNLKIKIGEWQPWRTRCTQKSSNQVKSDSSLAEDYSKKEDGQKVKNSASRSPSHYKKDEEGIVSKERDSKRRDSVKKMYHSRTSSGGEIAGTSDKDGRFNRRTQKMKDLQWVEKELQKIEREKLRLEQEREKYLEREARLEQMKRTIGTTFPAQEILVRTPNGFFRFKGISQKFTKKLYEWEKARNIAPEASTFALLEESVKTGAYEDSGSESGLTLQRSKSTGSVPEISGSLLIQSMAHHPSSLSLNDVDELKNLEDAEGLGESISSEQLKVKIGENDEPEAIIVDVEDIVEETAVMADTPSFEKRFPVYTYASDETDRLLDSSKRFPFSKNGGPDIHIIKNNETINKQLQCFEEKDDFLKNSKGNDVISREKKFKRFDDTQNGEETIEENEKRESSNFIKDVSDFEARRLSPWKFPIVETTVQLRMKHDFEKTDPEVLKKKIKEKIMLMERMSTSGKRHNLSSLNFPIKTNNGEREFKMGEHWEKENTVKETKKTNQDFHATLKTNKIKSNEGFLEDKNVNYEMSSAVNVFVPTTRKIISPVKTAQGTSTSVYSYVIDDVQPEDTQEDGFKSRPGKTYETKEVIRSEKTSHSDWNFSCKTDTIKNKEEKAVSKEIKIPVMVERDAPAQEKKKIEQEIRRDIGIPPLPNSPKTFKKLNSKETAPSIKTMIAKYNQKISENEYQNEKGSENGSPTMWRSPVFGRRTQEKIEKYLKKDERLPKNEVQKSASLENVRSIPSDSPVKQVPGVEPKTIGILKSNSEGVMKTCHQNFENAAPLAPDFQPSANTLELSKDNSKSPSVLRALKIQKAKEDFLSGKLSVSSEPTSPAPSLSKSEPTNSKQNLTVEGDSVFVDNNSDDHLMKSVSVERINAEKNSVQSAESQEKSGGTRTLQKSSSKFDISSIKSKFRKIRMRKEKESKNNTVAMLCRQSLLIEVPNVTESNINLSKSCPSSPVMDRNRSEKSKEASSTSTKNHVDKKFK